MQHDSRDWEAVGCMWKACPHAKAVPGVRVAYTDEREIQHAMDLGALVLVVLHWARSVPKREKLRGTGIYFPPLGKRSEQGGGQAFDPDMWGSVPGGYRNTINNNVVLMEMIENLDTAQKWLRAKSLTLPGVTAIFAASGDLGNFLGIQTGHTRLRAYSSTSCTMRHWRRASGCAACSPGATGPISRASRIRVRISAAISSAELPRNWVR